MRISDWSSDVCSSDLRHHPPASGALAPLPCAVGPRSAGRADSAGHGAPRADVDRSCCGPEATGCADGADLDHWDSCRDPDRWEPASGGLGRASCRVRRCQYVLISGVAVTLTKKTL